MEYMARARISLQPPAGDWKADVLSDFPEMVCTVPGITRSQGEVVEIVVFSGLDAERGVSAVIEHPQITTTTRIHHDSNQVIMRLRVVDSLVLKAANKSGTPLSCPLDVRGGEVSIELINTHERITEFVDHLDASGGTFDLRYIQRDHELCRTLTERQQECLHVAVEQGYYETPRQCSLTEVADELSIAKSTCSAMLHRIEEALVENFLSGQSTRATHETTPIRPPFQQ